MSARHHCSHARRLRGTSDQLRCVQRSRWRLEKRRFLSFTVRTPANCMSRLDIDTRTRSLHTQTGHPGFQPGVEQRSVLTHTSLEPREVTVSATQGTTVFRYRTSGWLARLSATPFESTCCIRGLVVPREGPTRRHNNAARKTTCGAAGVEQGCWSLADERWPSWNASWQS
ncbi:hypothetical protein K466DRAFT_264856 [Polyporus arcularius HHB13444]|uniref:Uncharacterized protein n=1 Tax=Polyporus arcularius HHB13444 TaxID=1314778 RepID=A0A5C3PBZ4_9APHY|nr:hypothetical protein K466DRAFT_264856 [Polyporus arcularius HHB13444]